MPETVEFINRSPAAERMRLHRERKKNGMRCLMIELRETEIDALIRREFLKADARNDNQAINDALYAYFEHGLT
jgi:SOS response regulatory protein OraA/RecX